MLRGVLPWLFAALAGPACLFLVLSVPLGEVPDEAAHAVRADSLWQGEGWGMRVRVSGVLDAGVIANRALLRVAGIFPDRPRAERRYTPEIVAALRAVRWDDAAGFVAAPNVAVYLPVLYVPASIGLGAARAAGLEPFRALLVARGVNAIVFVLLGAVALRLARAGRLVLFVTLMLPTSLSLAASLNPDGLLIAAAALGAALLTRGPGPSRVLAGVMVALLGAVKPCYLPLALVMAAPLAGWPLWRRAAVVGAVLAPGLIWSLAAAVFVAVPFPRPAYVAGPFWPGDPARVFRATDVAAQISVLAERPWRVLTLPAGAIVGQARAQFTTAIGMLGRLDLGLPIWLIRLWFVAGLAAFGADLARSPHPAGSRLARAALIALAVLGSVWAIFLLQYLSWTPVGAAGVSGVQGRYFVPLLPFVAIALAAPGASAARPRLAMALGAVTCLVAFVSVVAVIRLVASAYPNV